VAVLSDSKSSLQALARGGTRNRGALQKEILYISHQLSRKGCDLKVMWVPSHTGIRGNELADREAKAALTNGTPVSLGLSLTEVKSKVHAAALAARADSMRKRCDEKGWFYLPPGKISPAPFPRRHLRVLRRCRTWSANFLLHPARCNCGQELSLHHVVGGCGELSPQTSGRLQALRQKHGLRTHEFLVPHPALGVEPMRALLDVLVLSGLWRHF